MMEMPIETTTTNRYGARRISIFNHKGGVGKTTLTLNIAGALAELNKRVLLVDSDPQCNLTSYLVEEPVLDDLLDRSDSNNGSTIWSAVKPVVEGSGDIRDIKPLERLNNIHLLAGDIRLSEFEEELGPFWNDCYQLKPRGFRGTTALSRLVDQVARDLQIDFVFYDAGPNIGPLNRVIILDCDFFIVPAACDLFSIRALRTLGQTLRNWITGWRTITELAPVNLYLLPGTPRFLGYIPQRFKVYGGKPASDFAHYLPRIERRVQSDIVAILREIDPTFASDSMAFNQLGQVKDYASLAIASQQQGRPMWATNAGTPDQRQAAKGDFEEIAKKIIERTTLNP